MTFRAGQDSARFAFLLATPVIGAAALLKVPSLLGHQGDGIRGQVMAGAVAAFVAGYVAVRFLTRYFEARTLTPVAIYCALAGLGSLAYSPWPDFHRGKRPATWTTGGWPPMVMRPYRTASHHPGLGLRLPGPPRRVGHTPLGASQQIGIVSILLGIAHTLSMPYVPERRWERSAGLGPSQSYGFSTHEDEK